MPNFSGTELFSHRNESFDPIGKTEAKLKLLEEPTALLSAWKHNSDQSKRRRSRRCSKVKDYLRCQALPSSEQKDDRQV